MGNNTILIVDDMPDQIAYESAILKAEGYRVFAAVSGKTAFDFLSSKKPDLIVLDIKMSDMDGLEVCRRIKSNSETEDIPVIFVTANASPEIITEGFAVGCCDYVTKPFIKTEYLARIKTHLKMARQSQELLTAYNELNLFCSAVSHDLKAPLNVIRLLLSLLEKELGGKDGDSERIICEINRKSDQLILMIERLLEFSKMCNITPNIQSLNLESIINEICTEFKLLEPNRDIKIEISTLPDVFGDEVLVRTALKNVISNAFKFTRKRESAIIRISGEESGGFVRIIVEDNGAGFDMAYGKKLFTVFQRLHDYEDFEGAGVGLALVDKVMRRHGGRAEIYGEPEKGAAISLYFRK